MNKEEILDLLNKISLEYTNSVIWEIEENHKGNNHYYFIYSDSFNLFSVTMYYYISPVSFYEMDIYYNGKTKSIRDENSFKEVLHKGLIFIKTILISELNLFN